MSARTFKLPFEKGSAHYVTLYLHKTLRDLRRLDRHQGAHAAAASTKESIKDADAFCWQSEVIPRDGNLAEIHLAEDNVTVELIAHESFHAAFHRRHFVGHVDFEEQVATDTGFLADGIAVILAALNVRVRAGV